MRKSFLLSIPFLVASLVSQAQTKIKDGTLSTSPSIPSSNAILELESNNKGFIPPRIGLTGTNDLSTISTPTEGMVIYNTSTTNLTGANVSKNVTPGLYFFTDGNWNKVETRTQSEGANARIISSAYVGTYVDQLQNGITLGDFSFRISRGNSTAYTTSENITDAQVKYNGSLDSITVNGFASTMWGGAQFDYNSGGTSNTLFAPSLAPNSTTRNNNILNKNIWYSCGEPGFMTTSIEKRQYVLAPMTDNENYFYRIEWTFMDKTVTCSTCNTLETASERDGKVIIYIELVTTK